ncbi:hypothetical protein ACFSMW_05510 [Virgibacillus halophilus]|uniref:hypothetical protein n=1 Tax=Tigheibacillus halophilus TaxID=361280 RepID=UPI003637962C
MLNEHFQKGFTLYEVAAAAAILFTAISIVFPTVSLMAKERQALQQKILIASRLHDELELHTGKTKTLPESEKYTLKLNEALVEFTFSEDNSTIKGCAIWNNGKNKQETFCLYGYLPE